MAERLPILRYVAVEITTVANGFLPVGTRPLDFGIGDKRDRCAVALHVIQVDVEGDHALARVASASPIPVGVVITNRLGQSECGAKVVDCSGLSVEVAADRRFLAFFRWKSVEVMRNRLHALLPPEAVAVIIGDRRVRVVFGLSSVQQHHLVVVREGIDRQDGNDARQHECRQCAGGNDVCAVE